MTKVSVIMASYNRGWIIEKAIKSVLDQKFKDFELIIVDDGSTDNTKEVITKFSDPRIKVINLETNGGVSAARNEALKVSKGEFIAYLDSDNLWYPNFLGVMLSELADGSVLAYSSQNNFLMGGDKDNLKILGRKVRDFEYNPNGLFKYSNFIDTNATVHIKVVLDEVGMFDVNLKTLEDWDLFARIAIKYPFKVKHVCQVLGDYFFFLPETESTSVNSFIDRDHLLSMFNVSEEKGDRKIILDKLKKQFD